MKIIIYNNDWKFNSLFDKNNFIPKSLVGISAFYEVGTDGFRVDGYFFRQIM